VSSARDLDAVRQALGVAKISYFGETDGGLLGATYAAMYPHHVAAMVLDGAADHQLPTLPRLFSAARAGEDLFDRFAAWCHSSSSCVLQGQDVGAEFDAVVAAANHGQLAGLTGQQIQVTTSHLVLGEQLIEWPLLGDAIAAALQGDPGIFLALVGLEYADPGYTASRAAGCADFPARPSDLLALAAISKQFPHLGGLSEWSDLAAVCAGWPIPAANPPSPIRVTGAPPILIVNTTHDSTTPYPWAVRLAQSIAGSRLLTVDVSGHLGFDNSPGCAAKAEDAYLAEGTLPPPGTVCPA
jgi:pimeloyl-ACP methyl ester carboxylesterase